jgi:regulator of protease activity HflC (stomatin/prohibitin superfamily)
MEQFFIKMEETTDRWGNSKTVKTVRKGRVALCIIVALFLVITLFNSFTIVPTGYTGVRTTFGQIDSNVVNPGFAFKIPYVQSIQKVNNKQQDISFKSKIWSETSERTAIYFENVTVTYTIGADKSAWIYANVSNYKKTLVSDGIVASSIKAASKQFNSTDATNRSLIEPLAQEMLQKSLNEKYGEDVVFINKIVIDNIDFEDSYNQAIAAKQTAQLTYEQQQIENQRSIERAAAEAEVKKTQAQAEADAKMIAAQANADAMRIEADAEADANQKITSSLTDAILKKMYYDTWDGVLPSVYGADGTLIEVPGK